MLKNKIKALLALTIMFVLLFCPFVRAENEETIEAADTEYAEESTTTTSEQNSEETTKKEDVYLFDNEVTIDYPVDGNAFICAETVNIKSKIGGDLFVCANTVNIDNGYIYSNVFVCADTLNLNGVIYDLYATCSNINISEDGYVYRDLHAGTNTINLYGTVGRNAYIDCNTISLSKDSTQNEDENSESEKIAATIYGDLNYTSDNEIETSEGIVEGNVNYSKRTTKTTSWTDTLLSIITSIVFTILVCLALIWLAPKFKNKLTETLTTNIGPVIGFGALALICTPIIAFVLLLTQIGSSAGLLLATIYGLLIAISSSIFIVALADFISNKANINNKFAKIGIIAGVALLISLLKLIPYLSVLVTLICVWLGSGLTVKQLLPCKKEESFM